MSLQKNRHTAYTVTHPLHPVGHVPVMETGPMSICPYNGGASLDHPLLAHRGQVPPIMVGNPTHPLAHIRGPNIHFYQWWSKSISRFSSSSPSSSPATCKIFPNLSKTYLMLCITFPGKSHSLEVTFSGK